MTQLFAATAVLVSFFSYAFGVRPVKGPFLAQSVIAASGSSFSGRKECGERCIARAIQAAVQEAKQKCASEVEAISQWSIFHGSDSQEGYGASAMAEFKCLPSRVASK